MIATKPLKAPVRPCRPMRTISVHVPPRNRLDSRTAPHCRRCGAVGEPEDECCWKCGGEEMISMSG